MEEARKGPWTEQEDGQLVLYVKLFGERRWDFIAQVSGLKRTGKSCRLRWVNYLHPGLKRGKMTPLEERLVLDLHSKWGNRWSRIARKLPGRTDNEIKNYWRAHMRKNTQEMKEKKPPASQSSSSSSSSITTSPCMEFAPITETMGRSFYDTGGDVTAPPSQVHQESTKVYSMDEIWKDIELSEEEEEESKSLTHHAMNSPIWDFEPNHVSLMVHHMAHQFHFFPYFNHMIG